MLLEFIHADCHAAGLIAGSDWRRDLLARGRPDGAQRQGAGRRTRITRARHAIPPLPNLVVLLILVAVPLLGAGSVLAHAQQGTPAPAAITTEVLGRMEPGQAPGQALHLLRVTFAPGAEAAPHTHPGATIYHLDAGTLTFVLVDGSASLHRATGTEATPVPEEITLGEEIVLNPGDWITYEGDAVQTERNDGAEPAVILISNFRGVDEPARQAAEGTPTS